MVRGFVLLVIVLMSAVLCYAQDSRKVKTHYNYAIYLPEKYSKSNKNWPLVIYLHGALQRGNDLNKLKTDGLPALIDSGRQFNAIIASPQCPENKLWSTDNWLDSLYLELTTKYKIDTNRIYLTGISMGGYGTFTTALDYPKMFAAIVPLCGGYNDSDSNRICTIKDLPIWAFHGTADSVVAFEETFRAVRKLNVCKGNIKFSMLKNKGNDLQYLYGKKDIFWWMLEHKRNN